MNQDGKRCPIHVPRTTNYDPQKKRDGSLCGKRNNVSCMAAWL